MAEEQPITIEKLIFPIRVHFAAAGLCETGLHSESRPWRAVDTRQNVLMGNLIALNRAVDEERQAIIDEHLKTRCNATPKIVVSILDADTGDRLAIRSNIPLQS